MIPNYQSATPVNSIELHLLLCGRFENPSLHLARLFPNTPTADAQLQLAYYGLVHG